LRYFFIQESLMFYKAQDSKNPLSSTSLECCATSICSGISRGSRILIIPPDITRLHSYAGEITRAVYNNLPDGCRSSVLPATGTHKPMTHSEIVQMFGTDIPADQFLEHDWRNDPVARGVLDSDDCDCVLTGSFSRSKTKKRYAYYHGFKKCKLRVPRARLEEQFVDLLARLQPDHVMMDSFFDKLVTEWNSERMEQVQMRKKLTRELENRRDRKAKIEELAIEGTFDKETFQRQSTEVQAEIVRLESDLERMVTGEETDLEDLISYAREVLDDLAGFWLDSPFFLKKEFELALFPEGLEYKKKNGFRTPVTTLYTIKKTTRNTEWSIYASPRGIEPRLPG
jgi:hypothetical protein